MDARDVRHLRRAIELARLAREHGNHPFGSLLVSGSDEVLAEHENVVVSAQDDTGHPELTLVRWAGRHLNAAERAAATVYTRGPRRGAVCRAGSRRAGRPRRVLEHGRLVNGGQPRVPGPGRDASGHVEMTVHCLLHNRASLDGIEIL
jgi:hypothetical protein